MSKLNSKNITPPEPADPPALRGAKTKATMFAERAGRAAEAVKAASMALKEQAEAVSKKRKEIETLQAERDSLAGRLGKMGLDDAGAEKLSSRLRHAELLIDRLTREHENLAAEASLANQKLDTLTTQSDLAAAEARNAGRTVRLTEIQVEFPRLLQPVLDLFEVRRETLSAADIESHTLGLPMVGRGRVFVTKQQTGQHRALDIEELVDSLSRHAAAVRLVPSATPDNLDPQPGGNGDGDAGLDALVEAQIAEELMVTAVGSTLKAGERYAHGSGFAPSELDA